MEKKGIMEMGFLRFEERRDKGGEEAEFIFGFGILGLCE